MLLEFYGIKREEIELRKMFKTTMAHGTYWSNVVTGMKQLNIKFNYLRNQPIKAIEDLIGMDIPVVASIDSSIMGSEEESNHVVIVVGIENSEIIIHDPEVGNNIKINKDEFLLGWGRRDYRMGYLIME